MKKRRPIGDHLFGPGYIYLMEGRVYDEAEPIYKIGATTQRPWKRAKQVQHDRGFSSVRVLHHFTVDNMRVVESMLHAYFTPYSLWYIYTHEWFDIDHEAYELTKISGLYVNNCLEQLSGNRSIRNWWMGLKGDDLMRIKFRLWDHPALRADLVEW